MANKVARKGDPVTTNHACDATTTTEGASENVFINGFGAHLQGDLNTEHTILVGIVCVPHQTMLKEGSKTVFVNSKGLGRVGDLYSDADSLAAVADGSPNVFAG